MGSFAETYQGHGTDLALLAGVLGLSTMDDGIPNAKKLLRKMAYNMNSRKGCSEAIIRIPFS